METTTFTAVSGEYQDAVEATAEQKAAPIAVVDDPAVAMLFQAMRPADRLALATEIANQLRAILDRGKEVIDAKGNRVRKPLVTRIEQKSRGVLIGYSEHVQLEGWQTCGILCGVTAKPVWVRRDPDAAEETWEARAVVTRVDNGIEIGAGEGTCSRAEKRWSYADAYACKSMAQTRAQSRALSGVLRWIVVLAGYSGTPAEEMTGVGFSDDPKPAAPAAKAPEPERRRPEREQPPAPTPAGDATALVARLSAACGRALKLGVIQSATAPELRVWADSRGLLGPKGLNPAGLERIEQGLSAMEAVLAAPPPADDEPRLFTPTPAERPHFDSDDVDDDLPADADRPRKRLFALLNERGMGAKPARLAFARQKGIEVASFTELTPGDIRTLCTALELIPPAKANGPT